MSAAPVLHVVTCREGADCAIAALAMYLGESYEDVLRVVTAVDRHEGRKGLYGPTIIRTAKTMGHALRLRRRVDWEGDYGILRLPDHAVILRNGLVIDVDGTVWDAEEYLAAHHLVPSDCDLFVSED